MPRRRPALVLIHVVWATSGRRPILPAAFDSTLAAILGRKAKDEGSEVVAAGIASDHVHLLIRLSPSVALANLVQLLKGASAFEINQGRLLHQNLVWQAGYWAESLGPGDLSPLVDYLHRQRLHHDDSHPVECWQFSANPQWESAKGGL